MNLTYNIALVGRPNVGKSRLFNRLIRKRLSIVHDYAGVTRDIIMHEISTNVILMDTGGIGLVDKSEYSSLTAAVEEQVFFSISSADMILFVVDAQSGITPLDYDIAELLRKSNKPITIVANKIDCSQANAEVFYQLGFDVFPVSAEHGQGVNELFQLIKQRTKNIFLGNTVNEQAIKICFVGRPNVGKSSTVNALLNQTRLIVSEIPGTTRESVKTKLRISDSEYELIDTAGVRSNNRVNTSLDYFSSLRTRDSIQEADIVFIVLSADEGVTSLDKKIANTVIEAGKGLIVLVNKWDIAQKQFQLNDGIPGYSSIHDFQKKFLQAVQEQLVSVPGIDVLFISAEKKINIEAILPEAKKLYDKMHRHIGTGELNRVVNMALDARPPSTLSGKRFKIYYAVQTKNFPFTFKMFCNRKALLSQNYQRYLLNYIRREFSLNGCAIKFEWVEKEKRFSVDNLTKNF